jgi:hypothetical protein
MSETGGVHGGACCQSSQNQFLSDLRGFLEALSEFVEDASHHKGDKGDKRCGSRRRDDRDCGPDRNPPSCDDRRDRCDERDDRDCGPPPRDDRDDRCDDTDSYSGEARIWGDPHVEYDFTINGCDPSKGKFDTKGGAGQEISLLDTDNLDITGKFESWEGKQDVTVVGEETITAGRDTIEIDAESNVVTLNGRRIQDGEYCQNGNKVTKRGDTVTVCTADGQTIIVKDQGTYLDTDVKLKDLETEEMGGILGDAAKGKPNADATDYIVRDEDCGQGGGGGGDNRCPRQDASWASGVLRMIAGDPCLPNHVSNMLFGLANLFDSGYGRHRAA